MKHEEILENNEKKILETLGNRSVFDAWKKALNYTPRDSQEKVMEWIDTLPPEIKYILVEAPVGCHAIDTPIIGYDGHIKLVQEIKVGDQLMGPDGKKRTVLELHRGTQQMYKITPVKGDPFVVNQDHILSLKTTPLGGRYNVSGSEIVNISVRDYLNKSNHFKRNHKLYRPDFIEFTDSQSFQSCNEKQQEINPYFMGVLLGDGCMKKCASVTTIDYQIAQTVYEQAEVFGLEVREQVKESTHAIQYYLSSGRSQLYEDRNRLIDILKRNGLYGKTSGNKFIPHMYKVGNKLTRLEILAGLIDTDGSHNGRGGFDYVTKSPQLAEDIKFICRSLGLSVNSSIKTVDGKKYARICISGNTDIIPTRLERKKAPPRKQKKRPTVTGFSIEKLDVDEYYGFSLDEDHLYLLGDFIVTHNSGKSNLAMAFSSYISDRMGDSFILTPQKTLQRQYEESFEKHLLFSVYGRSNYECEQKNTTCDVGADIKPACDNCPAKLARDMSITSPNAVMNYTLALTYFKYLRKMIPPRNLMVLDEAHTLESNLVEFSSISVTDKKCKKYNVKFQFARSAAEAINWISRTYLPAVEAKSIELRKKVTEIETRGGALSKSDIQTVRAAITATEHRNQLVDLVEMDMSLIDKKYVLVSEKVGFKFKELYAKNNFKNICLPMANRFLFMSSTILDKDEFCRDLGIDPDESAMISLDSEFPEENREVIFSPVTKMNYGWNSEERTQDRKKMMTHINHVCSYHADESGVIHTGAFQVSQWILENIKTNHRIIHHNPGFNLSRDEAIDTFLECSEKEPTLLISPSVTEGMDLKDNRGRFALIVKVPYPYLGDAWTKRRMQISKDWYNRQAITGIIQGCGRVVRSKDDWGTVYILDESFEYLYNQTRKMIPSWWKRGLTVV